MEDPDNALNELQLVLSQYSVDDSLLGDSNDFLLGDLESPWQSLGPTPRADSSRQSPTSQPARTPRVIDSPECLPSSPRAWYQDGGTSPSSASTTPRVGNSRAVLESETTVSKPESSAIDLRSDGVTSAKTGDPVTGLSVPDADSVSSSPQSNHSVSRRDLSTVNTENVSQEARSCVANLPSMSDATNCVNTNTGERGARRENNEVLMGEDSESSNSGLHNNTNYSHSLNGQESLPQMNFVRDGEMADTMGNVKSSSLDTRSGSGVHGLSGDVLCDREFRESDGQNAPHLPDSLSTRRDSARGEFVGDVCGRDVVSVLNATNGVKVDNKGDHLTSSNSSGEMIELTVERQDLNVEHSYNNMDNTKDNAMDNTTINSTHDNGSAMTTSQVTTEKDTEVITSPRVRPDADHYPIMFRRSKKDPGTKQYNELVKELSTVLEKRAEATRTQSMKEQRLSTSQQPKSDHPGDERRVSKSFENVNIFANTSLISKLEKHLANKNLLDKKKASDESDKEVGDGSAVPKESARMFSTRPEEDRSDLSVDTPRSIGQEDEPVYARPYKGVPDTYSKRVSAKLIYNHSPNTSRDYESVGHDFSFQSDEINSPHGHEGGFLNGHDHSDVSNGKTGGLGWTRVDTSGSHSVRRDPTVGVAKVIIQQQQHPGYPQSVEASSIHGNMQREEPRHLHPSAGHSLSWARLGSDGKRVPVGVGKIIPYTRPSLSTALRAEKRGNRTSRNYSHNSRHEFITMTDSSHLADYSDKQQRNGNDDEVYSSLGHVTMIEISGTGIEQRSTILYSEPDLTRDFETSSTHRTLADKFGPLDKTGQKLDPKNVSIMGTPPTSAHLVISSFPRHALTNKSGYNSSLDSFGNVILEEGPGDANSDYYFNHSHYHSDMTLSSSAPCGTKLGSRMIKLAGPPGTVANTASQNNSPGSADTFFISARDQPALVVKSVNSSRRDVPSHRPVSLTTIDTVCGTYGSSPSLAWASVIAQQGQGPGASGNVTVCKAVTQRAAQPIPEHQRHHVVQHKVTRSTTPPPKEKPELAPSYIDVGVISEAPVTDTTSELVNGAVSAAAGGGEAHHAGHSDHVGHQQSPVYVVVPPKQQQQPPVAEVVVDSNGGDLKQQIQLQHHKKDGPAPSKVPARPDFSKVRVTGPGVKHGVLDHFQSQFFVETRGAGAGQLTVRIRGPKGAFQVEMYRENHRERTIVCRYYPSISGLYIVSVRWSGLDVPGSPFHVEILDTHQELEQMMRQSTLNGSAGTHHHHHTLFHHKHQHHNRQQHHHNVSLNSDIHSRYPKHTNNNYYHIKNHHNASLINDLY